MLRDRTEVKLVEKLYFKQVKVKHRSVLQCLLPPDGSDSHQNVSLNSVKALNTAASFILSRESPIVLPLMYSLRFETRPLSSFGHLYVAILHHSILSRPSYGENQR